MLKIRLTRRGKKHHPTYRIVVAESKWPRDGKFIEDLGYYNPMVKPLEIKVDLDKVDEWLAKGALPTEKVNALIRIARNPTRLEELEKKADERKSKKDSAKAEQSSDSEEDKEDSVKAEQSSDSEKDKEDSVKAEQSSDSEEK